MTSHIYDDIGKGYSRYRQADPRIVDAAVKLLDLSAGSIIADLGAGTGNYSRAFIARGFRVVAVEPSGIMRAQLVAHAGVDRLAGTAEKIPLADNSVSGITCILSYHHFADPEKAIIEMARVCATGPLVFLTHDPRQEISFWLTDYFPEVWRTTYRFYPPIGSVAQKIGTLSNRSVRIETFALPHDLTDCFAASGWRRPEIYLDPEIRAGMSCFALSDQNVIRHGVERLRAELASGEWDAKYGRVRDLECADLGYRFLCAR